MIASYFWSAPICEEGWGGEGDTSLRHYWVGIKRTHISMFQDESKNGALSNLSAACGPPLHVDYHEQVIFSILHTGSVD